MLRCPNCEWTGIGVFEQDIVERFDEELDRGTEALVARPQAPRPRPTWRTRSSASSSALSADAILPEDF